MKLIISFVHNRTFGEKEQERLPDPNRLLGIFDTDTKKLDRWITLNNVSGMIEVTHATGMCYFNNLLCVGMIPKTHRLTSKLLTINLETGEKKISDLLFTKGVHSIYPLTLDSNILLATSTQTDIISALTIEDGKVIAEDLYYDFLQTKRELTNHTLHYKHDGNLHLNSIWINNNRIWASMFHDPNKGLRRTQGNVEKNRGLIMRMEISVNDSSYFYPRTIIRDVFLPHTLYFDSDDILCFCESGESNFYYGSKKTHLTGFTRGICENATKKSFWVGISSYRATNSNHIQINVKEANEKFPGAMLELVDKETMTVTDRFKLFEHGTEIFDILPYNGENIS